jgi:3-oxoadipate enol-lactonase
VSLGVGFQIEGVIQNVNKPSMSRESVIPVVCPYHGSDGWPLYASVLKTASQSSTADDVPTVVLMHGGGPDHRSLIPLAERLVGRYTVVLPDVRGYGRSVCRDPARHTWAQYSDDVVALLDHLGVERAVVGGAGLGSTISLRTAVAHPERISSLVLISVEDIEDDKAKQAEIAFMEEFADRARTLGLKAAWQPILDDLAPIIGSMVRDAIPRSDPASISAAAAIGRDRSFRSIDELGVIAAPTLIIPGMDYRHPTELAERLTHVLLNAHRAPVIVLMSSDLRTAEDFGRAFGPVISSFLDEVFSGN